VKKKALKKELKVCKKQIRYSNYSVRGFMRSQNYQPGSYRILQGTKIWSDAKNQLLHHHAVKYQQLICFKCGKAIIWNPILHHKKYNWKKLFTPRYVGFVHRECHTAVHSTKRGYKKSLSYYQIKFLVMLIGIAAVLIILGISSFFNDLNPNKAFFFFFLVKS